MAYTPLDKPSKEIVLDLLNLDNAARIQQLVGRPITFDDVNFSFPLPGTKLGRNTDVRVTAKEGFEFPGDVAVHYNRLNVGRLGVGGTMQLDGYYFSISQLLTQFNETFELSIATTEVYNAQVDDDDRIQLRIRPDSYAYYPDTILMIKEGFFDFVDKVESLTLGDLRVIGEAPLPQ